jgi:hypothetical protein
LWGCKRHRVRRNRLEPRCRDAAYQPITSSQSRIPTSQSATACMPPSNWDRGSKQGRGLNVLPPSNFRYRLSALQPNLQRSHHRRRYLHRRCSNPTTYTMVSVPKIPHLQQHGGVTQLVVDGNPYLMLGGELQNSSLSSAEYMSEVWPKMVATNVNTLLGCVPWDKIEPVEGEFDFTELDRVILGAREHELHLILLWFGTWKNGK